MSSRTPLFDIVSELSLRIRRTRKNSNSSKRSSSSYVSYAVYQQIMFPAIFRDPDATGKLLEAILDSPGGRRSLSRLARTCKAMSELALNVLWRELDSLVPLIGLFPSHLLRKARKPGLGLAKLPVEGDWKKVLVYGERVRRITYDEKSSNVVPSIFTIIEEYRPRSHILPHLSQLTWKVETAAGLDRAAMFLNPELQGLALEIGAKLPQLNSFLTDMASRTRLSSFSFISPAPLPDAFTELLLPQNQLQKVALVAPGALAPAVGRWVASLHHLRNLQLDLTGRSVIAVEGFFDDIHPQSGYSTPSSVGSTDSGVFSSEEIDFSEIRKSSLRLTGDLRAKGAFSEMRRLHLTGEASNIAVFLKHMTGELTQLELVIEDPPDRADWQELSNMISDRFGHALELLRISATNSSRFVDLVRSTSRAEPPSGHLSLEHLTSFPRLSRLEIDLPESVIFYRSDIVHLASSFPNLEVLRLCPLARFPLNSGPPKLTLAALAPMLSNCRRLHTLAVVVNASGGSDDILESHQHSSRSLLRLHVGHSWAGDPLQVAILLSHFAPHLETLKWFHEKARSGVVETNAQTWQSILEFLPHLQSIRLAERRAALQTRHVPPSTSEKSVDATITTVDRGTLISPRTQDAAVQITPSLVSRMVDAKPQLFSTSVDATPSVVEVGIHAFSLQTDQGVDALPLTISTGVGTDSESTDTPNEKINNRGHLTDYLLLPSMFGLFSLACRVFISYPLSIPIRIINLSLSPFHSNTGETQITYSEKLPLSDASFQEAAESDISPEIHHELVTAQEEIEIELVHPAGHGGLLRNPNHNEGLQISIYNTATRQSKLDRWPWSAFTSAKSTMAEQKKQEKDFTPEVDAIIPITTALAQSGQLQEALDQLLALEKQTRNASDLASTTRLVKAAVERCYEARDYDLLNSTITLLSKKHGQLKAVIQAMVEQAMGWLEEIKKREGIKEWLQLVETLRGVTEGKIFLETPRARVTLLLSHHHESLTSPPSMESLQTACDLLSDLQVETYSSMERKEKTEFILEQMRLLIAVARQKDAALGKDGKDSIGGGEAEWVKVRVGGRKINEEFLKDKGHEDLKLKFYDLMIQHALNHSAYLDVAKFYYKVWETPSIKEDKDDKGKAALEHIVYYVVLAPHNNEQSDMLHRLFADPALIKLELQYNLVKSFTSRELMRWPGIETIYGPFLRQTPVFSADNRWEDLHTRVIEHNIRVVAEYYTRITVSRLTSLLDLTAQQTEEILARLVVSGTVWARIDRPAGMVNFRSKRTAEDVMNDWSSDMQKLLGLVEKTWMGMNAAQAAQSRVKA